MIKIAKIFIAGKVPEKAIKLLNEHDVEMFDDSESLISEEELIHKTKDIDALLSPLSTPVTEGVISHAENLKIIANFGAGFDNIAINSAKERHIPVTNTPRVSTNATADLTIGLIISAARRIPEGDELCRTKGFNGWAPLFFLGTDLSDKTLGIIGLGSIGQAVAKRAKAFGMNIIYTGPRQKPKELEDQFGASYVSQDELLESVDFITIHAPYSRSVHHMFNKDAFKKMKSTAFLINAARGPIVHEKDLANALANGDIKGAALDVFEFEPEIANALKSLKNVVLTPHIGNATIETRDAMADIAARNILAVLNGDDPLTPVF
ncbi:2-hydroxyacid dehydrogenase family protein [Bacillus sp. SD088]|uniref:2-hydroxyacid dehydrogenase family protein n=1 Tax=Bacillus sp. SD088 TaxID=2782012 RepID=UPI001A958D4F|nr:2-hydroxyacid dehydrogenase family protein [Bacillus sp. SD088]MBO0994401.1 2-hydroxyacid dehydrogenase family protein [Bacillus sp. SD088]